MYTPQSLHNAMCVKSLSLCNRAMLGRRYQKYNRGKKSLSKRFSQLLRQNKKLYHALIFYTQFPHLIFMKANHLLLDGSK